MSDLQRQIVIPDSEWTKLEDYTKHCPDEIACMGYAKLDGSNVIVDEVFLVPQVITLNSVEFIDKGLPYAVEKAVKENRLADLKFCWHSHATHSAFFSATDEDMIDKIYTASAGMLDWFASAVLNKKGDIWAQVDWFPRPNEAIAAFEHHLTLNMGITIDGRWERTKEAVEEEMYEFAERKKLTFKKSQSRGWRASDYLDADAWDDEELGDPGNAIVDPAFRPVATHADYKLHREAREQEWECYIDSEEVAHYFDQELNEDGKSQDYKGSAVIPLKHDGTYAVELTPNVFASDSDATTALTA